MNIIFHLHLATQQFYTLKESHRQMDLFLVRYNIILIASYMYIFNKFAYPPPNLKKSYMDTNVIDFPPSGKFLFKLHTIE